MRLQTQIYIKNNPYLKQYLRENSYWYKELNRNHNSITQLEQQMKEAYHLTTKDRLENLGQRIELIQNIMEILN